MKKKQYLSWLEKNNLLDIAKNNVDVFKNVLKTSLNIKHEKVLLVTDTGYSNRHIAPLMSASYLLALKELDIETHIEVQNPRSRGEDAEHNVISAISDLEEKNIIILSLSNRLGSLKGIESFRDFARKKKHRFISTPSMGLLSTKFYPYVIDSIDIDYKEMNSKGRILTEKMDHGKELHLTSEAGTDLYINIKGKKAILNDGIYNIEGTGGNLPAGEVYTPPFGKKKINGKIVIDGSYSYRYGSKIIKNPIYINIERDKVVSIRGGKEARDLDNTLSWAESIAKYPWGIRRLGEVGIGINPNASILGSMILDEKSLGTAHIALGSNHWFGGTIYAITHLDQVMKNIKVFIDDELFKFE